MARKIKMSVGVLNIALHPHSPELYAKFLRTIFDNRVVAKLSGDRYGMISLLDEREKDSGRVSGIVTTFVQIEADGDWFDTKSLNTATADQVSQINIPPNLKANSATYYFEFDLKKHRLYYQNYSKGRWITAASAARLFSGFADDITVFLEVGSPKISIVQETEALDRILSLPKLTEIKITLLRPNPDILDDDFEDKIEANLAASHSRSLTLIYNAEPGQSLVATEEIRRAGTAAIEIGKVEVKGRDETGAVQKSTEQFPLVKQTTYDPDATTERNAFFALLRNMFLG
ncbi:DUF4747 family protein [Tianweitania sp.]|uniref:DUF4747 family protein n=1 Tax=Tianweitania sp. TaxID=2021634 RepID=UPI00289C1C35|nr:DUF4747 family protein [Tianweitania sp.]